MPETNAMTIFHIMRHGEHSQQGKVAAGRLAGIGLSERGRGEVEAVAARLVDSGLAAIYASPLERTRETAGIIGQRLGLPVAIRDELIEVDFGLWTGSTFDEVRADPRWHLWATQRSIATIPDGENMRQVQRRIVDALIELHQQHGDETVLVVSHGDVIRAALAFVLGMPLDLFTRLEVATASLSTIRIDTAGLRVISVNERLQT